MTETNRSNPVIPPYFLRTPRLRFRTWTQADLPLALSLWGDENVTKFIDARGILTTDQISGKLAIEIQNQQAYGVQYWPMFLLATGEHVGVCGLRPRDISNRVYELGVHIRPKFSSPSHIA